MTAKQDRKAKVKLFSVSGQLVSTKITSNEFGKEISEKIYILRLTKCSTKY